MCTTRSSKNKSQGFILNLLIYTSWTNGLEPSHCRVTEGLYCAERLLLATAVPQIFYWLLSSSARIRARERTSRSTKLMSWCDIGSTWSSDSSLRPELEDGAARTKAELHEPANCYKQLLCPDAFKDYAVACTNVAFYRFPLMGPVYPYRGWSMSVHCPQPNMPPPTCQALEAPLVSGYLRPT